MLSLFVSLKIDKIHHVLFVGMEMLKTNKLINWTNCAPMPKQSAADTFT